MTHRVSRDFMISKYHKIPQNIIKSLKVHTTNTTTHEDVAVTDFKLVHSKNRKKSTTCSVCFFGRGDRSASKKSFLDRSKRFLSSFFTWQLFLSCGKFEKRYNRIFTNTICINVSLKKQGQKNRLRTRPVR